MPQARNKFTAEDSPSCLASYGRSLRDLAQILGGGRCGGLVLQHAVAAIYHGRIGLTTKVTENLKTLKFHSVFRTRPAAPLTFLLMALFFVAVLPSSYVFADGFIFRTCPSLLSRFC